MNRTNPYNKDGPYKAASTFRMPYGKFKGHMICTLDITYIQWMEKELLAEGRTPEDEMVIELRKEIKQRGNK